MKTIKKYEASDIDFKDPVHGFLMGALLVNVLTMTTKEEPDGRARGPEERMKTAIATFLSMASEQGIVISKEGVPEVFKEAYR